MGKGGAAFGELGMCFREGLRSAAELLFKHVSSLCMGVLTGAFIYVFTYVLLHLHVWWGAKKTTSATLAQALFTFLV